MTEFSSNPFRLLPTHSTTRLLTQLDYYSTTL